MKTTDTVKTTDTMKEIMKGKHFKQASFDGYVKLVDAINHHTDTAKAEKAFASLTKEFASIDFSANDFHRIVARLVSYSRKAEAVKVLSVGYYRKLIVNEGNCLSSLLSAEVIDNRGVSPEEAEARKAEKKAEAEARKAEKKAIAEEKKSTWQSVKKLSPEEWKRAMKALNPFMA